MFGQELEAREMQRTPDAASSKFRTHKIRHEERVSKRRLLITDADAPSGADETLAHERPHAKRRGSCQRFRALVAFGWQRLAWPKAQTAKCIEISRS
jgi:hypothetical protein